MRISEKVQPETCAFNALEQGRIMADSNGTYYKHVYPGRFMKGIYLEEKNKIEWELMEPSGKLPPMNDLHHVEAVLPEPLCFSCREVELLMDPRACGLKPGYCAKDMWDGKVPRSDWDDVRSIKCRPFGYHRPCDACPCYTEIRARIEGEKEGEE